MLLIGSIAWFGSLHSEVNGQAKVREAVQVSEAEVSGIILNNTDYNETIAQSEPNLGNVTVTPRIITEYSDFALNNNLNSTIPNFVISPRVIVEYANAGSLSDLQYPQGLNATGVTPRVIVEYADYMVTTSTYTGPDIALLSISSPIENPPDGVPINTNKTISFNVTSIFSPIKNMTLSYKTTLNQTWQPITIAYASASNVTMTTVHIVIPGQSQPCSVYYEIEAYNYQGDYAVNNNAGQYYVYNVAVPEFQPSMLLPLFMTITLIGAMILKRKRSNGHTLQL
jgi:hypothetical protein